MRAAVFKGVGQPLAIEQRPDPTPGEGEVAATRKAIQETGIGNVKPIQVVGVWNTFFPTSHWDTDTRKGTQTVNAVVLVEITSYSNELAQVKLDNTSEQYKWISLDPDQAIKNNEDPYVWKNLQRLKAWNPNY